MNYLTSLFNNHLQIADCPSGYVSYDEHCYGFVDESKTWKEAQDWCKEVGDRYDLVVIDNENENQFLIDHRNKKHIGKRLKCDDLKCLSLHIVDHTQNRETT